MKLVSSMRGEVLVIVVEAARIDAAVAVLFKDEMRRLTGGEGSRVVLDMGQVDFIDSSGLGALVAAMKQLGGGRRLELASINPAVDKVLRLTRMDTVFVLHDTPETATGGMARAS